ncbi:Smr/MutS family protein [Comamonas composti]|uniref:Smr/MutS family protein n=1 Tax=Comamonas composti TaxID=408558 RepID=UPI0003F9B7FA|nr:Smr/MutS family protein [Comamonas composti]
MSRALHSLQDLASISRQLKAARERAQELARQEAEARAHAQRERNLFALTVGPVMPLRERNQISFQEPPPSPLPLQLEIDEQRVLQEAMSDEFDVSTLLDTDDQLSFRRSGIGLDVTRKLRGGHWSIQRQLDLHGLRSDEAREALGQFIRLSHRTGVRCVRIVHGKGLGSPGRVPVLKAKVQRWLVQKKEVLAFVQARPADGGAGALVVLLQPGKR